MGTFKMNIEKEHITITDIARMAGVSITTVSRVLNKSNKVKEDTRDRVQQVIDETHFIPSASAKVLVNKKSNLVGLLIPDILNPFYSELILGVETVLNAHGYSLFLCITDEEKKKNDLYIRHILEKDMSGVIVLSADYSGSRYAEEMEKRMKIVSVQANTHGVNRVDCDNFGGTYLIVNRLIERGHTKIAFLGYNFGLFNLRDRLEGYKRALSDHHIPLRDEYIAEGHPRGNPGYELAQRMLGLPEPPTAIHCMNEYIAMGVYMALEENHVEIPKDMSVTGFDGLQFTRFLRPRLETVSQNVVQMGKTAAEMMVRSIENPEEEQRSVVLPAPIIPGDSVGLPAAR